MTLIRRYGRRYAPAFILAIIMVALEALCDVLQPTLLAQLVDEGIASGNTAITLNATIKMVAVALLGAVFALIRACTATYTSLSWAARLRSDLYRRIMSRSPERALLDDSDSLLVRLTHDVTQTSGFFNGTMRIFIKAPLVGIMAVIMAWRLDPQKAIIAVLIIPLVLFILAVSIRRGLSLFGKAQTALDRFTGSLRRVLEGLRLIKGLGHEDLEQERFGGFATDLSQKTIRAQWHLARIGPHTSLLVNLGIAAILLLGWRDSLQGSFKPGAMIAFVNYMGQVLFALGRMTAIINRLVQARVCAQRIREVLDSPKDSPQPFKTAMDGQNQIKKEEPSSQDPILIFDRVSYTWPGAKTPILKDISFSIDAGETVALIGSTASGKSTLIQLACGLLCPQEGSIHIRGRKALVPQEVRLFSGSIRENLLWGNPQASQEELEAAAQIAAALDFIQEAPKGWDTVLGRGGSRLSGGQRQRLSLARAILRSPQLLLLDDASSSLDSLTEAAIRKNLSALPVPPAILLVVQRIRSAASADRVLVLDQGCICAQGSHSELLGSSSVYRDIVASQTGLEADGSGARGDKGQTALERP